MKENPDKDVLVLTKGWYSEARVWFCFKIVKQQGQWKNGENLVN